MTEVDFYDPLFDPGVKFTYSVISARYRGKWLFVRHHRRITFEIAGGHVEEGESPDEAASRELAEETGAEEFSITCIATYSVTMNGEKLWGRLYFAEVTQKGPIPDISEIAEVVLLDYIPDHPTHPDIQPHLFRRTLAYLAGGG